MWHPTTLITILAIAQTSLCFYPYQPKWRCTLDDDCDSSGTASAGVSAGASISISQRAPKNPLPHAARVRQLADKLASKYQRKDASRTDSNGLTKRISTGIMSASTPSQTDSAALDQDGTDYSYFATVDLGSNSDPYYMLIDTGASNTWVMGSSCTSAACTTHKTYGASDSGSFNDIGQTFSYAYGSGSVTGDLVTDSLSIAGMDFKMTIGVANTTSDDFTHFPFDGILGMSLATGADPSFLETMVSSKALKANVFGVSLNRASDGTNNGEINFGAPDTSRYSGSLAYTSVSTSGANGDWAIPMQNVGIGTQTTGISNRLAVIDTGTSFIFAPPDDVKTLHGLVSGAASSDGTTWTVPCSTTDSMTVAFSGNTYTISSEDWVGPEVNGVCTSNVYGEDVIPDSWLLGDTFLKNVYTLFDVDQKRVGFGAKASSSSSSSSSTATSSSGGGSISMSSLSVTSSTSDPSTTSSATTSVMPSGTTTTSTLASQTSSNQEPTGSGSHTGASATGTATPNQPGFQGVNGQQTSTSSSATGSPSPTAKSDKTSAGLRLDTGSLSCILLFATFFFML